MSWVVQFLIIVGEIWYHYYADALTFVDAVDDTDDDIDC